MLGNNTYVACLCIGESSGVWSLCVCGGVLCAIADAGSNPVTVNVTGCHTSVTSPSRISLSLTLHNLPTGELIYCTECFLNKTIPKEGFQACFLRCSL